MKVWRETQKIQGEKKSHISPPIISQAFTSLNTLTMISFNKNEICIMHHVVLKHPNDFTGKGCLKMGRHRLCFPPQSVSQWRNPASPSPACSPCSHLLRPVSALCSVSCAAGSSVPFSTASGVDITLLGSSASCLPCFSLASESVKEFLPLHADLSSSPQLSCLFL